MADLGTAVQGFFSYLSQNPIYFLLFVGGFALAFILIIMHHIHRIRSQEIFVHQAWGSKWRGR